MLGYGDFPPTLGDIPEVSRRPATATTSFVATGHVYYSAMFIIHAMLVSKNIPPANNQLVWG